MEFTVEKAKREKIYAKIALMSPSGGGKSYSSLRLATGMLNKLKELGIEKNGRILLGNTESSRGRYYANEFEYDIVNLEEPHSPEMYVDFINWAVKNDYPILIIDSSSHEWEGSGGCLELHQKAGGTYQAWAKITPRHDKFIQGIADSPIHVIATMRGKDAYEIQRDANNKMTVKKLGVGAKQREGFEYEFTVTFLLDQKTNTAEVQKDNTHLFDSETSAIVLDEDYGSKIIEWANSGEGYTIPVRRKRSPEEIMSELKAGVIEYCKTLGGSSNEDLMAVLKRYEPNAGNPNKIKDIETMSALSEELKNMKFIQDNNDEVIAEEEIEQPKKKSKKESKELENA